MRQIKFRAWDKEKSRMSSVGQIKFSKNGYGKSDMITKTVRNSEENITKNPILMQFTGLTDKNGREIYEGDILRYTNKYGIEHYWTVYWDDINCRFKMFLKGEESYPQSFDKERADSHEVVGNVYEK